MPKFEKLELPHPAKVIRSKEGLFDFISKIPLLYIHNSDHTNHLAWRLVGKVARHIAYRHLLYVDRSIPRNKMINYAQLPGLTVASNQTGYNFEYSLNAHRSMSAEHFFSKLSGRNSLSFPKKDGAFLCVKFSTTSKFCREHFDFTSSVNYVHVMKLMGKWWVVQDHSSAGVSYTPSIISALSVCPRRNDNKDIADHTHAASIVLEPFLNMLPD